MVFGCFWKFLTVALIIQNMIEKIIAFDPSQKKTFQGSCSLLVMAKMVLAGPLAAAMKRS